MATTKTEIFGALEELKKDEFKKFKWYLSNSDEPIPQGTLEKAVRHDVVDLMVQHYNTSDAGKIAVRTLRKMKQNELADRLEGKLQEVQQPELVDGRNASESVEDHQSIQSDRERPQSITPSSQDFKRTTLRNNRNHVYIPKDKYQRRRLALLITNIRFKELAYRKGAKRDEENMEWLLTALGYRVEKYTDLTGEEIDAKVRDFAARPEHRDSDSTFVVLMSHGTRINNKDVIIGVDYPKNPKDFFFVDDIFSHLNSENCPALIDKPKVILIEASRAGQTGGVDVQSDYVVPLEKDFFCFKSCLPGNYAYRHTVKGSFFICYIVDVFCKWAHVDDIMELFRKVTLRMATDQLFTGPKKLMPCLDRTCPPKKLYLFPGL